MECFFHFVILCAAVIAFQVILYFGSQFVEGEPRTVGWRIDERIPLVPGFIYIYVSWFALLALTPFALWLVKSPLLIRFWAAQLIDVIITIAAFLIWPTTFTRPEIAGKGLTRWLMEKIYGANHRFLNCAPSMHCSLALLMTVAGIAAAVLPIQVRAILIAMGLLICASTMLVKQHVFVDFLTAIPVTLLSWVLAGWIGAPQVASWLGIG